MSVIKWFRRRAVVVAVAVAALNLIGRSNADSIPPGWEANNMEAIGYSALEDRKGAFKMAIKKVDGRCLIVQ